MSGQSQKLNKANTRVCRNDVFNPPVIFERAGVYFWKKKNDSDD